MLSKNIRMLRSAINLSQVELAKQLGVTKQCVSNWENDNILPSIDMLVRIARFFNVTTDYLLGLENKNVVDISKLSVEEASHIKLIIKDLEKGK